ncbi:MAG: hypothetical protein IPH80_29730 [Myxococcales bacterium]|nr:hypothetical protein [Myxococcales bacterium]
MADGAVTEQVTRYHQFHVEQRRDSQLAIGPTWLATPPGRGRRRRLAITRDDGAALDPRER